MTRRTKRKLWNWFWRVVALFALFLLLSINGNQQSIMIMQTDTLNALNDMRIEQQLSQFPNLFEDEELWDTLLEDEPTDSISVHNLSPEEFDLICKVVAAEARGEDLQGQMAVAQTILDRSELWNMTPSEVVQAPGQYADPYQGEISDEIHLAVANVFDGGVRVFNEPTTHFYSGPEPYWADEKINRGSVGRHQFCY